MPIVRVLASYKSSPAHKTEEEEMNGKSECCGAPTLKDSTGDVICLACGIIQDNYPENKEAEVEDISGENS